MLVTVTNNSLIIVTMNFKVICALFFLVASCCAYPTGAPVSVCDSMEPIHDDNKPQTRPSPYHVTVSQTTVSPNSEVQITVEGTETFKGIFMQVRNEEGKAKGKFVTSGTKTTAIKCHGTENSAVTHTNADPVDKITVEWIAPEEPGTYHILLTTVKTFDTFWVKQDGGVITVV